MPISVENPSFELAGAVPGLPAGWHRRGKRAGLVVLCGFADRAAETFPVPNAYSDASWTQNDVTVADDATDAPDLSTDADQILEDATSAEHSISATDPITFAEGGAYTITIYAKDAGRGYAGIALSTSGGDVYAIVTVSDGRVTAYPVAAGEIETVHVDALLIRDSWLRISLTILTNAELIAAPRFLISDDGINVSYAGDNTKGLYLWGDWIHAGTLLGAERFDGGWEGNESWSVSITGSEAALFTTDLPDPLEINRETFETGWLNTHFTDHIIGVEQAIFDVGINPNGFEDFTQGWDQTTGDETVDVTALAKTAAVFGALAYEDFAIGWSGSDDRSETIVTSDTASFDGGVPENYEDFEEGFANLEYTVDTTTNILTSAGHGRVNGDTVFVRAQIGGKLCGGTNGTVKYYAEVLTVDTLRLHTVSVGGPVVDYTDTGEGTQYLRADPARFWTGDDIDLTI